MKFVSWNVNGLRACVQKGFLDFFNQINADFFCLQETKLQAGQITLELPGYEQYWCYAEKKGYSGTAIFTKHTPMSVRYGIGIPEMDAEGRVIALEYPEFFLVTCYTPNAQRGLARIDHRLKWEEAFRNYLTVLDSQKPIVLCGDLNVAHREIDLKNPAANRGNAGFSDQERQAFTQLLECGFTDTFRHLNPDATGCYTWWSYMFNARQNNAGWRIDYFLVSDRLKEAVYRAPIHSDILGSDHCPVELDLDISCNGSIWLSDAEGAAVKVKEDGLPISTTAKKALLSGTAALLLAAGFAAGFFTNQLIAEKEEVPLLNISDSIYSSGFVSYPIYVDSSGAIVQNISVGQAKNMTTDHLITYATQIPELIYYYAGSVPDYYSSSVIRPGLDPDDFEAYKKKYPVLAELETREDAGKKMRTSLMLSSAVTYRTNVLALLLTLDVFREDEEQTPTGLNASSYIDPRNVVTVPITPAGE